MYGSEALKFGAEAGLGSFRGVLYSLAEWEPEIRIEGILSASLPPD